MGELFNEARAAVIDVSKQMAIDAIGGVVVYAALAVLAFVVVICTIGFVTLAIFL